MSLLRRHCLTHAVAAVLVAGSLFAGSLVAAAVSQQTPALNLDPSSAFFTDRVVAVDATPAATTTAGDIRTDSFHRYAGERKSPRILENLAFDFLLARECEQRGLAHTAPTLARAMAMRLQIAALESKDGTQIGGSLARYATDELRDQRIRALVGARRAIDDEALLARFDHRYGVDGVRVRVRQILFTDAMSAPQTAAQRARALHAQLQNGTSFDELLAQSHDRLTRRLLRDPERATEAGVLAGYNYYRYGEAFAAAVRALQVGEVSQPVTTDAGSHLIQVVDRKVTQLATVRDALRLELGGGKARSSEVSALRQELFAKYRYQPLFAFGPLSAFGQPALDQTNQDPAVAMQQPSHAAATASEWPHYRGNPQLPGVAVGEIGAQPTLAWTFQSKGEILSSPTIADDTVFIGSTDNSVYAIDGNTGTQKWSYATDDMVEAPPLVLDGRIYIGSNDCFLYALDQQTGALIWKFETADKILGGANWLIGADGKLRIVVGSYDANVYCLDAHGNKLWSYETDNYVNGTPAIRNREIVFGGCDAALHLVHGETGQRVAKIDLGSGCQVAGSVSLLGDKAYFGHYGNEFLCVDLQSGKTDWRYSSKRDGFVSSPAVNDRYVVFGGRDKHLHCALRADGTPQWQFKTRRKVDASPVIAGDKVLFGSGDGRLYMLSLADGKELWNYDIGKPVYSSPAVVTGMIVVGASDHRVYAFHAPVPVK